MKLTLDNAALHGGLFARLNEEEGVGVVYCKDFDNYEVPMYEIHDGIWYRIADTDYCEPVYKVNFDVHFKKKYPSLLELDWQPESELLFEYS